MISRVSPRLLLRALRPLVRSETTAAAPTVEVKKKRAYVRKDPSLVGAKKKTAEEVKKDGEAKEGLKTKRREAKKEPKSEKRWEESVIRGLAAELREQHSRYFRTQQRRAGHAQLLRFATKEDVAGIMCMAEAELHARRDDVLEAEEREVDADPQLAVALSLLVTSRIVAREAETCSLLAGQRPKGLTATAALCNLMRTLEGMARRRRLALELKEALIVLWCVLEKAKTPESRDMVTKLEDQLKRIIRSMEGDGESRLLLREVEKRALRTTMVQWDVAHAERPLRDDGYDEEVELVRGLRQRRAREEFLGNPFAVEELNHEELLKRYEQQLKRDQQPWLEVPNVFVRGRERGLRSAEQVIADWKWEEKIGETLNKHMANTGQLYIRDLLQSVPAKTMCALLHRAVVNALAQGMDLLPLWAFEQTLALPILNVAQKDGLRAMQVHDQEVMSSLYAEYVHFFTQAEIARRYTHREWWMRCARKHNVHPAFEMPLSRGDSHSITQLAKFLLGVVLEACRFPAASAGKTSLPAFATKNVGRTEQSFVREEGRMTTSRFLLINSTLVDLLQHHQFDTITFPTWQLPMIVPPRPWLDRGRGGPSYSGHASDPIRNLSEFPRVELNQAMRQRLQSEKHARPVWDALNCLGSTAWTINRPVLGVLKQLFERSKDPVAKELLTALSIPMSGDTVVVPARKETGVEVQMETEEWAKYYKEIDAAEKERNELKSQWCWLLYRLVLAEHFSASTTLFFPHNMDFRGRVYPISPLLNHMGDDANRALLVFARGKPLGPDGLNWLKLHCINLTGKLKRNSIADRRKAAEELTGTMIDSAERPMDGAGWWRESEEPWQTLAACMEVRDAMAAPDPAAFISHLPVHQDGSCNGLQHYAALGRDQQGGSEVNLVPGDTPSDVYSSVAARVEQRRLEDEAKGDATAIALRKALPEALPRKVLKQTIMTTVYGVTMFGAVLQVNRQLKALGMEKEQSKQFATYLAKHAFGSLSDAFAASMAMKEWLRQCAKATNDLGKPIEWVTPLGLPVLQPYLQEERRRGEVVLAPVKHKQVDACPPNYVHSLDSTHMQLTALHAAKDGFTFAAVHDCFWTHAADADHMNGVLRQEFVALHTQELINQLSAQLKAKYLSLLEHPEDRRYFEDRFSPKVKPGQLNIADVLKSTYFFG